MRIHKVDSSILSKVLPHHFFYRFYSFEEMNVAHAAAKAQSMELSAQLADLQERQQALLDGIYNMCVRVAYT